MKVAILGAGAMGAALTVPYSEKNEVFLWGTEFDVPILEKIMRNEKHPRIDAEVRADKILMPDELEETLNADVIVLAISTEGVLKIFERISEFVKDQAIITVAKGLAERDGEIYTIPEAIWLKREDLREKIVAITGPSIAREVAKKLPTHVVYSSLSIELLRSLKNNLETNYYRIKITDDIVGCELTSALKNVYSIAIAWIRGVESRRNLTLNNLKGILATQTLWEISKIVEACGGRKETTYDLSGIVDIIATFRGGRNGMLGELLGKGFSIDEALKELERRGVGVVEGYQNAGKAYKLAENLDKEGKIKLEELKLLDAINSVLYEGMSVDDALDKVF